MNDECIKILHERKILLSSSSLIPVQKVREWMSSPYCEVQGAAFSLLFEDPDRLELPTTAEINEFYLDFLERCLRKNVEGVYVPGRYMAGHTLVGWFQQLWREKTRMEPVLQKIRNMLMNLCYEGDDQMNDAIITAILEHLFEKTEIQDFFSTWANDPRLIEVYKEAIVLSSP